MQELKTQPLVRKLEITAHLRVWQKPMIQGLVRMGVTRPPRPPPRRWEHKRAKMP